MSRPAPARRGRPALRVKAADRYHHGDLRRSLLQAAQRLLESAGLEALSLRRLAAELGVSHAAPAHHFPSLRHLQTALAGEGFDRFAASLRQARAGAAPDPAAQLRAAERGYLHFARAEPALFRLMFNCHALDWTDPALAVPAASAYAQLSEVAAAAAERLGVAGDDGQRVVEELLWSQIHGRAHLAIDGKLGPEPTPPRPDLAELIFERGLRRSGPAG